MGEMSGSLTICIVRQGFVQMLHAEMLIWHLNLESQVEKEGRN